MADEPTLSEVVRITDRHERKIGDIEQHYVSEKVFLAMLSPISDRVLALEQADTSKTAGNRTWLLNLAGIIVAAIVTGVVTVLIARGGH